MSELYGDMPQSALEALVRAEGEQARMAEKLAAANERIAAAELTDKLRDVAAEAGVTTSALTDFLNRGRAQLRMKDGRPAGQDGAFVSLKSWASDLRSQAPHLFEGAPSPAAAPEATKPSGPRGNVKRRDFDGMQPAQKRNVVDAIRRNECQLVD